VSADDRSDFQLSGHSAFDQLVRGQRTALLAHVRLVYPLADAEAVVNDSFSIAWRRLDDAPVDTPTAWLRSIARYVVLNSNRGERRWRALNDRVALLEVHPNVDPPDTDARLQLTMVVAALERLGHQDRELLLMLALEDLTTEDVATIYDLTETAAKVRISRARKRLRAAVASAGVAAGRAATSTSNEERRRSR
jgi:RNA polymerase sigma factor (sigma-70 family)